MKPVYSRGAQKNVGAMPKGDAAQLVSRINAYAADPMTPNVDVNSVKGRPGVYRLRWGGGGRCFVSRTARCASSLFAVGRVTRS